MSASAARLWLALAAFLGIGMLPCPEYGTPMILHLWPLAGLIAVAQALRRHYQVRRLTGRHNPNDMEDEYSADREL